MLVGEESVGPRCIEQQGNQREGNQRMGNIHNGLSDGSVLVARSIVRSWYN